MTLYYVDKRPAPWARPLSPKARQELDDLTIYAAIGGNKPDLEELHKSVPNSDNSKTNYSNMSRNGFFARVQ